MAVAELNKLAKANRADGSISGREMAEAIFKATRDFDNQAAGTEFTALKQWVKSNGKRLSPEARAVFDIYSREATEAREAGRTGIELATYKAMRQEMLWAAKPSYQDVSAAEALEQLAASNKKPGSISGQEMMDAIVKGTEDADGQATDKEFADLKKFVTENARLLSPEAKSVYDIYAKQVKASKAKGHPGISDEAFSRMTRDMLRASKPNYQEPLAAAELNKLAARNKEPGSISGNEMMKALMKGTAGLEGESAKQAYQDIEKFVKENKTLLSEEAKATYRIFDKYAKAAAQTEAGVISLRDSMKMQAEMAKAAAPQHGDKSMGHSLKKLAERNKGPGSISGEELTQALLKGSEDGDNQTAGVEFGDALKFVTENSHLLSPEAKKVFAVYQRFVDEARAQSQTGLSDGEFKRMSSEMKTAGTPVYRDDSAEKALTKLAAKNTSAGSISGNEMMKAIIEGTKDVDGHGAGKEYRDFAKFVRENDRLLSAQAKETFAVFEKAVKAAQAKGHPGFTEKEWDKLVADLGRASE